MCVRISLLLHKTNQLAAGSHSRSLAVGVWWLSTRSGLPVAGDWRRRLVLRRSHPVLRAASCLQSTVFLGQPLAVPVGRLLGR